ncbi:hypothetical protein [Sorangium atrum]|uniref:Alpha/beta hydrolase n=1 Tax=Sorangium atrum TaxID=2995308 RepID=A0ABT5C9B8_9BACT|nr:hypothetical protein [Sorangium aterium]MDC0681757.1 hypothetical protein [Sorangium aterium]
MFPAEPPCAEVQLPHDDDEPTLIFRRPPASIGGMAMPFESPAPVMASPTRRSTSRLIALSAGAGLGFAAVVGALVSMQLGAAGFDLRAGSALQPAAAAAAVLRSTGVAARVEAKAEAAAPVQATPATAAPALAAADRADATLDRTAVIPIPDGIITIPASFASADGAYDLVIHFHGVNDVVQAGFDRARVNAVVMIINLGISSGAYETQFSIRSYLPALMAKAQVALEARGLRGARLRRVALSAFSAGYAAVRGLLNQPGFIDKVDAVLLLDGIHTGYMPLDHSLDMERLKPFSRFAELAAEGKKLMSITHSEITPNGDYAGTHESTDALLKLTGAQRTPGPGADEQAIYDLTGEASEAKLRFAPLSEAHRGALHVRGYPGTQKPDHVRHLTRMAETALPDLVRYWSEPPAQ